MALKIRTHILLFLFVFALLPLLAAVIINLPLVLERVEMFYRHAIVQDMRSDFSDLDRHLASREEMVRLLAKLPEPGVVMGTTANVDNAQVDNSRVRYTEWINRIFDDQHDVVDILFVDSAGVSRFWLNRNSKDKTWRPTLEQPRRPGIENINDVLRSNRPGVLLSPVIVDSEASEPTRAITLQMLSPLGPSEGKSTYGVVVMTLDIGGLVRREADTLWVHDDGRYLTLADMPDLPDHARIAFENYPGLKAQFATGKMSLWEGAGNQRIVWVPLLRTTDGKPLWVGRRLQNEPLTTLTQALIVRVLSIVLVLIVVIWLMARWAASRLEQYAYDLVSGIRLMLKKGEPVNFTWGGSSELQQLGLDLSELSREHSSNLRNLKVHARELEESSRFQTEFMANVSHELRTPLNSILLLSKVLGKEAGACSAEQKKQIQVIHEASNDLRSLIDNVLDLSKIEAGRLIACVEEVQLPQLLQDMVTLLQPQYEEKKLPLLLYIADDAPHKLQTDPDKLRQILKNFLSNALKFTHKGSVQLHLEKAQKPYAVKISVVDSGIGIAQDKQELIFEAFKQADGSTRRRYGGTGLGLSISQKLASVLCGELFVESQPNKGATFSVVLPNECGENNYQLQQHMQKRSKPTREAHVAAPPQADFSGHKVLIVEQDIQNLLLLSELLESWGMDVLAAGDAEEYSETLADDLDLGIIIVASDIHDLAEFNLRPGNIMGKAPAFIVMLRGSAPGLEEMADEVLNAPLDAVALHGAIKNIIERA